MIGLSARYVRSVRHWESILLIKCVIRSSSLLTGVRHTFRSTTSAGQPSDPGKPAEYTASSAGLPPIRRFAGDNAFVNARSRWFCKSKVHPNDASDHASLAVTFRFQSKLNETNVSGITAVGVLPAREEEEEEGGETLRTKAKAAPPPLGITHPLQLTGCTVQT